PAVRRQQQSRGCRPPAGRAAGPPGEHRPALQRERRATQQQRHRRRPELLRGLAGGLPLARKLRARDRPLTNDFVSEEEFGRLLRAWFGNLARVLLPGRPFYIWGGYTNCGNSPPVLKACGL